MEIVKGADGFEYVKLKCLHTNGIYKSILIEKEDFKTAVELFSSKTVVAKPNPVKK